MTSLALCPTHALWRRSASLLLVTSGINNRLRILTVKRSPNARFMPNNIVFPGGLCEPADFSMRWLSADSSINDYSANSNAVFPDIFENDSSNALKELNAHVGFRLTALRELFEEAGLCLSSPKQIDKSWREKVHKNAEEFINMHNLCKIIPNVDRLHNWSTWLTPKGLKHSARRYDTQFYIAFVDDADQIETSSDNAEVTDVQFRYIDDLLEAALMRQFVVAPPQLYELQRLRNFDGIEDLRHYAKLRDQLGTERIFPVTIHCTDGPLMVLPGDSLYPENPDLKGERPHITIDRTIEESMASDPRQHRVMKGTIIINFPLALQQRPPKAQPLARSKL